MFIGEGCLGEGGIWVIFIFLLFSAFRLKNEDCFYNQKTFSGKKRLQFTWKLHGWVVQEGRPEGWAAACSKVTIGTGKKGQRKEAQPQVARPISQQALHSCKHNFKTRKVVGKLR